MFAASYSRSLTTDPTHRPTHGGNLVWAASIAACEPGEILDFSASINPLGPPASAIAAMQANLIPLLRAYPDPSYADLRAALGEHHNLDPDWILPGNGAAELLTWCARELSALPATYLPTPAFGDYRRSLAAFSAKVVPLPLPLSGPFLLPEFPAAAKTCGLILNNPHNPTGGLFERLTLLPLLEKFALVVLDEAFMDFLPGGESFVEAVRDWPNLVILRSLTKFFSLPGLRIGYAIAHPERLRRWQQWRDPWSVNAMDATAASALTDQGSRHCC
ncbi:MAG: aminotransferase class I/II-fold pyridoxal phosphate-dependent enzyme, partial [Cyanobacteria bacterium J06641_5]